MPPVSGGVTPYMDIDVEDEDSLSERMSNEKAVGQIDLVVVRLPRISNFTILIYLRVFRVCRCVM